jgi:hypothetical protein
MFTNISTADKIETIVDCFMQRGITAGVFGSVERDGDGSRYTVQTDGRTFTVYWLPTGWHVREGDAVGVDASLVYAASNLIGADLVRKSGRI